MEVRVSQCEFERQWKSNGDVWTIYIHPFQARPTFEAHVKIEGLGEPILALIGHRSDVNIVSRRLMRHTNGQL